MPERLSADDLARFRADYHQCGATIVPLLDEIAALTAERDEALAETRRWRTAAQARGRGHHDRMAGKTLEECPYPAPAAPEEETSERAWWAVEWRNTDAQLTLGAVEAERDAAHADVARLRALLLAVCRAAPEAVLTGGDTSCTLAHLARRLGEGRDDGDEA